MPIAPMRCRLADRPEIWISNDPADGLSIGTWTPTAGALEAILRRVDEPHVLRQLRALVDDAGVTVARVDDRGVRAAAARLISTGRLRLVRSKGARRSPPASLVVEAVAAAAPATAPQPAPRAPRTPAAPAAWPGDASAQAEALVAASVHGLPFCEICEAG